MSQEQYITVQRRSATPYLLLILVIMNALSTFMAFTYYQRVSELEKTVALLNMNVVMLSHNVNQLSQSYRPVAIAFDYYVKMTMARMLSEMYNISFSDALAMIEKYYPYAAAANKSST